jgi:diguanylate cyclase (GGDEF)-like protein
MVRMKRHRKTDPALTLGALPTGRRIRPLQVLLGVLLVGVMISVELLLLRAYTSARETTSSFKNSTLTVTNLANVQREILLLNAEALRMVGGEDDVRDLKLQRALLARQLSIAVDLDVPNEELQVVLDALDSFDSQARHLIQKTAGQERSTALKTFARSSEALEREMKELYDRQEQRFLGDLGKELESGASSQQSILLLGIVVMVIALTLAVLIRRSVRSDFQRAFSALIHEVDERKLLEERLTHQAFHDALTGLANRALFIERVEKAVVRTHETGESTAVIFIDLDDFKTVNDTLGHEAGDRVLKEAAKRLDRCVRGEDTAARLGGDEFAVLLEHSSDVERVAERILETFLPCFRVEDRDVVVRPSIGIAVGGPEVEFASTMLANADIAMYAAKGRGKDQYAVFAPGMQEDAEARMRLRADMQGALATSQFLVHYQPIFDLQSGHCVGSEALVRWNHPEFGLVLPGNFIPVAEASGFIYELGLFVLNEATQKAALWQDRYSDRPLSISVNVSASQLQHVDLVGDVQAALRDSGLRPELLVLEITETVLMLDPERATRKLTELKKLGVIIAIDDFGTGYSSLSYLRQFPIDTIKIDKSFIDSVQDGPEESALARAVVKLGASLGLTTVAEGIETYDQLATLSQLGCNLGQGYLMSRPIGEEGLEAFLASGVGVPEHAQAVPVV